MYAFAEKLARKGKKKNECEEETEKVDCYDGVCGDGAGVYDDGKCCLAQSVSGTS